MRQTSIQITGFLNADADGNSRGFGELCQLAKPENPMLLSILNEELRKTLEIKAEPSDEDVVEEKPTKRTTTTGKIKDNSREQPSTH